MNTTETTVAISLNKIINRPEEKLVSLSKITVITKAGLSLIFEMVAEVLALEQILRCEDPSVGRIAWMRA